MAKAKDFKFCTLLVPQLGMVMVTWPILLCEAMLSRYMQLLCVYLFVCPSLCLLQLGVLLNG